MKKALTLLLAFAALLMSGCALEDKFESDIVERSEIPEDEDYIQYQQYRDAGMLDENGQYAAPVPDEEPDSVPEAPDGKIRVTFAENRYLKIAYYTDAAATESVDTENCYLDPGEALYARVIECTNPNSNLYRLAEYRILEYDAEGKVRKTQRLEAADGMWTYEIPANFTGSELSVIPVGEYPDRSLSMRVYYVDDGGVECPLGGAGTWSINGNGVEDNMAQISPIESYVLKFTYDTENYFYVESEPDCFTRDPAGVGFVEFWEAEPTDADLCYSVELHKFLELSLKFSDAASVRVNQGEAVPVRKNKVWNSGKLRYGDSITIETAGDCTITGGDYPHIRASRDPITGGYRYTLKVVPEAESSTADILTLTVDVNRVFRVTLGSECSYGSCTYKLDGKAVSGEVSVQEGQKLTLTYRITADGYAFAEKSEGIGGFFHDLFKGGERTVEIPITAGLDGATVNPDDWFDIVEKGA